MTEDYSTVNSQHNTYDQKIIYFTAEQSLKIIKREPIWWRNYEGGTFPAGTRLIIKSIYSEDDKGRLLYLGKPFDRRRWSWRPPKIIRMMGRHARDYTDLRNSYPTDEITHEDGSKERIRATCKSKEKGDECKGKYLYDQRYYLYCERCFLIRNEYHLPTVNERLPETSGAPMDDHDLSAEIYLEKRWSDMGLDFV